MSIHPGNTEEDSFITEVQNNLVFLSKSITNIDEILIFLEQKNIISYTESGLITDIKPPVRQNRKLLELLKQKGWARIRSTFTQILRDTSNSHCAEIIENEQSNVSINSTYSIQHPCSSTQSAMQSTYQKRPHSSDFNITGPAVESLQKRTRKNILSSKWWPEEKYLPNAFYERKSESKLLIEKLRHMLLTKQTGDRMAVITQKLTVSGLGGIGKTTTAKWFAKNYQTEYDYVFWIDCGEGSLLRSFTSLAKALKIVDGSELGTKELAVHCYTILKESNCLFVFDNAECYLGEQGIRNVLPMNCLNFHVIITSRNTKWGNENGDGKMQQFKLGVFDENESVEFLSTNIKNVDKQIDQLRIISQLLGNLPLALQIAVAAINEENMDILEYINRLHNTEHIILSEFDDYEKTINKTMQISMQLIQTREACEGKLAYKILNTFGYLTPDDVSSLFFTYIERKPSVQIDEATRLLESYSLITKTVSSDQQMTLSVHRLLQQVIRHNGKDTRRETLTNILKCTGFLQYKLIPYGYADAELKKEFPKIRCDLIDKVKLNELLAVNRFQESVELSRFIHEIQNTSVSEFNHAVCLKYNYQIHEAKQILEKLYRGFETVDKIEKVISRWGIITQYKKLARSIVAGQLFLIYAMENKIDDAKRVVLESNGAVIPSESQQPFLTSFNAILYQNYVLKSHDNKSLHLTLQKSDTVNTFELKSSIVNEVTLYPKNVQNLKLSDGKLAAWNITWPISLAIRNCSVDLEKYELDKLKVVNSNSECTCMLQKILDLKTNVALHIDNLTVNILDSDYTNRRNNELLCKYLIEWLFSNHIPVFSMKFANVINISLSTEGEVENRSIELNQWVFDADNQLVADMNIFNSVTIKNSKLFIDLSTTALLGLFSVEPQGIGIFQQILDVKNRTQLEIENLSICDAGSGVPRISVLGRPQHHKLVFRRASLQKKLKNQRICARRDLREAQARYIFPIRTSSTSRPDSKRAKNKAMLCVLKNVIDVLTSNQINHFSLKMSDVLNLSLKSYNNEVKKALEFKSFLFDLDFQSFIGWKMLELNCLIIKNSKIKIKVSDIFQMETHVKSRINFIFRELLNVKMITTIDIRNLLFVITDSDNYKNQQIEIKVLLAKYIINWIIMNKIPFFSITIVDTINISLSFTKDQLGRRISLSNLSFDKYFILSLELDELTLTSVKTPLNLTQFVDFSKVKKFTLELEADLDANDIEVNTFDSFFLEGKLWFKKIVDFIKFLGRSSNILFLDGTNNSFSLTIEHPKKNPIKKLTTINDDSNDVLPFQDYVQELETTNKELLTPIEVPIQKLTLKDMKGDLSFPLTVNELVLDNVSFSDSGSVNWTINQLLVRNMNFVERREWTVTKMTFESHSDYLLDISALPTTLKQLTVNLGIITINSDTLGGECVFSSNIKELNLDGVHIKWKKDRNDLIDVSNSLPPHLNKLKIDSFFTSRLSVSLSLIRSIQSLDLDYCTLIINRLTLITPNELTLYGVNFIDENGKPIPSIRANDFIDFSQMQKLYLNKNKGLSIAKCDTAHIKEVDLGDTKII